MGPVQELELQQELELAIAFPELVVEVQPLQPELMPSPPLAIELPLPHLLRPSLNSKPKQLVSAKLVSEQQLVLRSQPVLWQVRL